LAILLSVLLISFRNGALANTVVACPLDTPTEGAQHAALSSRAAVFTRVRHVSGMLRLRGGAVDKVLEARLKSLITKSPVMLFMKGSPEEPRCGFSKRITELLQQHNIQFGHFDILEDQEVRQGLKEFSSWPTYPQLYRDGEFIGGLDILLELEASGDLEDELKTSSGSAKGVVDGSTLENKISKALDASVVKATDESDGCGAKFSVLVVSPRFAAMPLVERQRAVHAAIAEEMPRIHALTLRCRTPEQYERDTAKGS